MHSRIFCVGICIFGLLLKIRERFSLLRAENEEAGRTISLHKCQMEKMPAQRAQGGMGLEQAIIDIRNMYKIYNPGENEVRALDGVSLAVYKGEFVAIVGHSGSGKSTLMNMIGCLDTPTSGTYFLNGQDVSALSDNALSAIRNEQIGFIFQSFNLIKNLNALENVELPLIYRGPPENGVCWRWRPWSVWALRPVWTTVQTRCPAASSSVWPWLAPSRHIRRSSSRMNRRATWTPERAPGCSRSSVLCTPRATPLY